MNGAVNKARYLLIIDRAVSKYKPAAMGWRGKKKRCLAIPLKRPLELPKDASIARLKR